MSERNAFVGYCRICRGMVAAVKLTESRRERNAAFVSDLILSGARVDVVSGEEVRNADWSCRCKLAALTHPERP